MKRNPCLGSVASGIVLCGAALLSGGCGPEKQTPPKVHPDSPGAKQVFLLDREPAGAQDVIALRESAKDGEKVAVVGRIGGGPDPWVKDRAAFWVVDRSLPPCSDRAGDTCPTPWDYCCDTDRLPKSRVLVKVMDANGTLIATDARELLEVKELQTVVVRGQVQRDDAGNVSVLADGVYVKAGAETKTDKAGST